MHTIIRSSFLWQFASGFALGAVALVALQPAQATETLVGHLHHVGALIG